MGFMRRKKGSGKRIRLHDGGGEQGVSCDIVLCYDPPMKKDANIILIGMPAAGKSTVGRILARDLGFLFMDTDSLIEQGEGRKLHEIIAGQGMDGFRHIEEAHVLGIRTEGAVIATGGSVVYGQRAMAHLKRLGTVVYLRAGLDLLLQRLDDPEKRGVVRKQGQSFASLFEERNALYLKHADCVVECLDSENPRATADRVMQALRLFCNSSG